jgi:hypothetical protein
VVNETQIDSFYVGGREDGKFVAASVDSVVFCFVTDTEEEAFEKACRAYAFGASNAPRTVPTSRTRTSTVINIIAAKRVPICEPPLAVAAG